MAANLVTHPLEFLKVRQQLYVSPTGARGEPSLLRLLPEILRNEGVLPLYTGLSAGLWRAVISGGGRLTIYNQLKLAAGSDVVAASGATGRAMLGVVAGGLAALLAVPFDLVRTRQQAVKRVGSGLHQGAGTGMGTIFVDVARREGLRGLWAGSVPTIVRQMLFTAVQLASYDQTKHWVVEASAGSSAQCGPGLGSNGLGQGGVAMGSPAQSTGR
jgi:hypothetical protein